MRRIVRASARVSASSGAPTDARYWETRIARNGRGGQLDTVANTLKAEAGGTGTGDAAPMVIYNITPESGQGADLRACEVTTSTAVTVTEHAKQTDRGIRVVAQAPRRAQALDGKDVRLADKTGALTASMNSSRVSNSHVGMVSYEVDKERGKGIRVDETTTSPTITAGGDPTERTDRGLRIVGERKDPVDCVTANSVQHYDVKSAQAGHLLGTTTAVRRLTPTECERLQGFPDGWTVVEGVKPVPRAKKKAK